MSYGKMSQTLTILSNVNEKKAVSFTENEKDNILGDVYFSNFQTYSLLKADYTTTSFF